MLAGLEIKATNGRVGLSTFALVIPLLSTYRISIFSYHKPVHKILDVSLFFFFQVEGLLSYHAQKKAS